MSGYWRGKKYTQASSIKSLNNTPPPAFLRWASRGFPLLWILADDVQEWANTLRCGLFPLHPDWIPAKSTPFQKKKKKTHSFIFCWWQRSAFPSVLGSLLWDLEVLGVFCLGLSNVHIWSKMLFWVQILISVINGDIFKFPIESRVKGLLQDMCIVWAHSVQHLVLAFSAWSSGWLVWG